MLYMYLRVGKLPVAFKILQKRLIIDYKYNAHHSFLFTQDFQY